MKLEKQIKLQRIIIKQKEADTKTGTVPFDETEEGDGPVPVPQEEADEEMVQELLALSSLKRNEPVANRLYQAK